MKGADPNNIHSVLELLMSDLPVYGNGKTTLMLVVGVILLISFH